MTELTSQAESVNKHFTNFSNYIELEDFRHFLLFTLTSQTPMNLISQLGFGGDKETINLPYDPIKGMFFQKINLISAGVLIIYFKSKNISEKFLLEKDDPLFKNYLSPLEMEYSFRGKEKFVFPQLSDCSNLENTKIIIKLDDLYHTFESFIAYSQPNILFIIDGSEAKKPDLVFSFNMMPQLPSKLDENVLKIDVYFDKDHKTKNMTYLKREDDYKLTFLKEVKDLGHAEVYKSAFSLLIHIKSFNSP